jgi:hypothetical protein
VLAAGVRGRGGARMRRRSASQTGASRGLRTAGGKNVAGLAGLTGEGLRSRAAEQRSSRAAEQQSSSRGLMEPAAGHRGHSEAGCWQGGDGGGHGVSGKSRRAGRRKSTCVLCQMDDGPRSARLPRRALQTLGPRRLGSEIAAALMSWTMYRGCVKKGVPSLHA